jgi:epoxyqueuosine reductase QueG
LTKKAGQFFKSKYKIITDGNDIFMDKKLTFKVKELARILGVDLVGFANIERFGNAPVMMSPQGILPTAKTVIVCAVHHPDATIELEGGEKGSSQVFESYGVQYTMNNKLDHISFRIAHYLDAKGYPSVPITASNIWRYRSYKELDAVFAPDMSHIYASVAAGLTVMGWNGIALSPEYGPRNRFVSIITEAELEPTPLYDGEMLCDMCGECIKYCPTDAYRKEVNGVKTIQIEDKIYKFANKNLWRCAWGEHFDIDLDGEIPDIITEKEILETIEKKGRRGGEMGTCLKVCVPKPLRYSDPSYSKYYRRKRHTLPSDIPADRSLYDLLGEIALKYQCDRYTVIKAEKATEAGYTFRLPDAKSVIVISAKINDYSDLPAKHKWRTSNPYISAQKMGLSFAGLDIAREIEKVSYSTMPNMTSFNSFAGRFVKYELQDGESVAYQVIITNAPFEEKDTYVDSYISESPLKLKNLLKDAALEKGADMMGVSTVERIENLKAQLMSVKNGEKIYAAHDKNRAFKNYDPVVNEYERELLSPEQYIKGAKSVIVLGLHFPSAASARAGKPPAEAIGPYVFTQYQVLSEVEQAALEVIKELRKAGFRACMCHDLLGLGSFIGSPRGEYSSPFDGTLEAAAAGLGEITYNGNLYTKEYGINQRFICIVTDALIDADTVIDNKIQKVKCSDCGICFKACPMKALEFEKSILLSLENTSFSYVPLNTVYCQWASRYALTNRDGFIFGGSKDDYMPDEDNNITAFSLAEALKLRDPILKGRPLTAEQCVTKCPLSVDF